MSNMRRTWRRRRTAPSVAALLLDIVVVVTSIYLAWQGRAGLDWFNEAKDVDLIARTAILPMALLWLTFLAVSGAYGPNGMGAGTSEYRKVLTASLLAASALGVACYLLRFPLSRGLYFLTFLIGIPLLLLGRYSLRRVIHRVHERGRLRQNVILVGSPRQIDEVAGVLVRESWLGYEVVGAIVPPADAMPVTPRGIPVLGTTARAEALAREWEADVVLFAGGAVESAQEMRRVAWSLEPTGARIMLVPSLTEVASERIRVRPSAGLPLMEIDGPSTRHASRVLKRAFDLAGASLLLVLTAPLLAVAALAVKLFDGGPVIYRQIRTGREGEPFACLKLRTMVVDAERLLDQVPNGYDDDHVLFKAKEDPRITRPGRFLRRYSIDELPQLFNVLGGSMSLVGPRPPLPVEVARYTPDVFRRLAVRPGITGLWQVSGRSDLSWEDTVRLDLYYVDNWSILRDLAIIGRTAHAVLASRGAY
ncbi:MAG TPA: sugar transferase [Phycicoccus sp.]|nr:sugar transferase [Phycicoccus sp.]